LFQLSGGERQRTLLARALVQGAEVLFLDEALSKMDLDYQFDFGIRLKALLKGGATDCFRLKSVVLVSHDLSFATRWADDAIVLQCGKVLAKGQVFEALSEEVLRTLYPRAAVESLFQK
jgi:iron complex transport system ATP-binding protein